MALELYREVALTRDLPEYRLKAGDVATLIDFVSHPSGGEAGCLVETILPQGCHYKGFGNEYVINFA
ncbi:MAG: DUF4926 domain-containing protein [Pseudanabaenales cyanobacterium]|nr:DUF4926 domain-containing protein [Pseudanabaenales cyanobacterium]